MTTYFPQLSIKLVKTNIQSVWKTEVITLPINSPWLDWCYGHDSLLWLGNTNTRSRTGVQQGDPLGPPVFSLALHQTTSKVRRRAINECPGTIDFMVFYLDDGIIAGTAPSVQRMNVGTYLCGKASRGQRKCSAMLANHKVYFATGRYVVVNGLIHQTCTP